MPIRSNKCCHCVRVMLFHVAAAVVVGFWLLIVLFVVIVAVAVGDVDGVKGVGGVHGRESEDILGHGCKAEGGKMMEVQGGGVPSLATCVCLSRFLAYVFCKQANAIMIHAPADRHTHMYI